MLKMRNIILPAFLFIFLFSSCTKQSEESMLLEAKTKMEEAVKLEGENKPEEAKKAYENVIAIYKQVLDDYPNSEKAPSIYSNIAKIYSDNLRDYNNAIIYYKEASAKFPETREAKYAMFMIAFIYDEMLKDKDMAKDSYKKFLDKYPKDDDPNEKMSESARMMLQMLEENRSIEEIIKGSQQTTDTNKTQDSEKKEVPKDKNLEPTKQAPVDDGTVPEDNTSDHPKLKNKNK
jgi:tetratricopeptide (TPR) repeat protein